MRPKLNINFSVPKLPGLSVKPPRDLGLWMVQGMVVNSNGRGVEGIQVLLFNLDDTSVVLNYATTDAAGLFRSLLPPNNAGYQAQPCAAGHYSLFCPAFFIFKGNSPVIRFTAVTQEKEEPHIK